MRRYTLAGACLLALCGTAMADGFIARSAFSGGESVITFNTTDMGSLGHPTANIGSGITVTDSGGGTGSPGWRGNFDWSSYFDNIPGSSQGRALADSWGASDLLFDFTGAGSPNRVGMLLSTGTLTSWTVEAYGPSFNLLGTKVVTMPASQDAVFVGYQDQTGVGFLRITDVENGFITIMDDVRFENANVFGTAVLDFEHLQAINNSVNTIGAAVVEDAFQVTKGANEQPNFAVFGTQETRYPGSTALFNNTVNGLIRISAQNGSAFDVRSIDFAMLNGAGSVAINLVGNKAGGGQVFQTINHSDGGLPLDLITYNLNGFTNLTSIEWAQESPYHQFDNVVIRNIQCAVDQNQASAAVYMAAFSQTNLAQSFRHQTSRRICGAGIFLQPNIGSTDNVRISLWDALPNAGGTMLATGSAQGTQGQWVDVTWNPVSITANRTYYLVFDGNTTLGISGDTSNPYPHGQVYANAGYQSFPSFDYTFRTYSTAAQAGISLTVTGTCPGQVTVSWSNAQQNATVALIFAKNTGSFVIPFGPCQGTVLGLGNQGIRLVNTFPSGLNGSGSRSGNAGSGACRGYLQMHDIPNCTLSNVARLP